MKYLVVVLPLVLAAGAWFVRSSPPVGVSTAGTGSGAPPAILVAGVPAEGTLAAGAAVQYRLVRVPGRRWVLRAEQLGIDVELALVCAGGQEIAVDGRAQPRGEEVLLVPEDPCDEPAVELRARPGAAPGRYRLELEELAGESESDRLLATVAERLSEAGRGALSGSAADRRAALEAASEALRALRRLGDRRRQAEVLEMQAELASALGRPADGVGSYREAIGVWRALGARDRLAAAENELGLLQWELGDNVAADARFTAALELADAVGDRLTAAHALNNRCLVTHARGDVRAALPCYRSALAAFRELGETASEATALNNLGYAFYTLGEPEESIAEYERAIAIRRRLDDPAAEAQSLNNLAVVLRAVGDVQGALERYDRVRELLEGLDEPRQEAAALNNLGVAYQILGEHERARPYLERALALRRRIGDRRAELATLNALGRLERWSGHLERAVALHDEALALARAVEDRRGEGLSLLYAGDARAAAGDVAGGLSELDGAVAALRQVGDRGQLASALHRRAEAETRLGRLDAAREDIAEAVVLRRELGDAGGEASARAVLARVLRRAGDLDAARAEASAAVDLAEAQRFRVGGLELRPAAFRSQADVFGALLDVLADLHLRDPGAGHDRTALEVSERMRARSLRERMELDPGAYGRGIAPELRRARASLVARLRLKADREAGLRQSGGETAAGAAALALESRELIRRLEQVEAEIRAESPAWAAVVQPEPLTAAEIQVLLDPDTVLLEYALGDERSLGWAVTATSIDLFTLPGREEIESLARPLFAALSAPPSAGGSAELPGAAGLARLLIAPVWPRLQGRRVAVAGDGVLHSLPFAVLPVPEGSGAPWRAEAPAVPLLVHGEVVELPSASVLAAQRRRLAERPPAPELALVLADPVFAAGDPRVAAAERAAPARRTAARVNGRDVGPGATEGAGLGRLWFSRREAEAIGALAPGRVRTLLDFDANRATLNGELDRYRFVHLATHGLVDLERPHLSALMLSQVEADGRPRDGRLGLWDLYDLELGADLVVLSGCRTALGRELRGEGLLGLTRAFLYAGSPRVVASLWWVEDRATAALMERFYGAMWSEEMAPAAALRRAQLELREQHRYRHPFYWAPFVLQGDWR